MRIRLADTYKDEAKATELASEIHHTLLNRTGQEIYSEHVLKAVIAVTSGVLVPSLTIASDYTITGEKLEVSL